MDQQELFEPEFFTPRAVVKPLRHPIWTENKAQLIDRYLYYFVLITKHGTYIDCFAGPQEPETSGMWSAQLVMESEPRRLRHFYLFDNEPGQVAALQDLRDRQRPRDKSKKEPKRTIRVVPGDCNIEVPKLLATTPIREREATFCLLDQRTFECHWATVEALARYKSANKIELFYFLPNGWLGRAIAALKKNKERVLRSWWGRDDWTELERMNQLDRVEAFVARFRNELGYKWVMAWPIFERSDRGNIMYYMIHATDHPEAPQLMRRAYSKAVTPKEPVEQLTWEFAKARTTQVEKQNEQEQEYNRASRQRGASGDQRTHKQSA